MQSQKKCKDYKGGPSNFSTTNLCIVSLLLNCRLLTFGCVYFCSIGILTDLEVWRQVCPEIFHQMLKVCASAWLLLLFHKISISQFIFVISSSTRKLSVKSVRSSDPRQFLLLFISNFFWAWTDDNQDYMLHFLNFQSIFGAMSILQKSIDFCCKFSKSISVCLWERQTEFCTAVLSTIFQ